MNDISAVCRDQAAIRRDPLAIPEILSLVGLFLDTRSLAEALRVGKAWYSALFPQLWAQLQLFPKYRSRNPSLGSIQSHASWVFSLDIGEDRVPPLFWRDIFFPKLSHLVLSDFRASQLAAQEFIRRHRLTLKSYSSPSECSDNTLAALSTCPVLDRLKITKDTLMENQAMQLYEKIWFRQTELWLRCQWRTHDVVSGEISNEAEEEVRHLSTVSSNIEVLTLQRYAGAGEPRLREVTQQVQFWLIRQCHNLVKLHWSCRTKNFQDSSMHLLAREMRLHQRTISVLGEEGRWRWKRLESLVLPDQFCREDFETLLDGLSRLTELDLMWANFDLSSWRVLQGFPRHMASLRILNIKSSMALFGGAIQSMLCSLLSLEWFEAGLIRDLDIIKDDRRWVCLGLKKLALEFKLESRNTSESMILSRISTLEKLEELVLTNTFMKTVPAKKSLRLSLKNGMEQLRTLRRLEVLMGAPSIKQNWEREDAAWALENWPRLVRLNHFSLSAEAKKVTSTCPK